MGDPHSLVLTFPTYTVLCDRVWITGQARGPVVERPGGRGGGEGGGQHLQRHQRDGRIPVPSLCNKGGEALGVQHGPLQVHIPGAHTAGGHTRWGHTSEHTFL